MTKDNPMTPIRIAAPALFLACIIGANYTTTRYGMIPVGFGLQATAGTYLAGATFILRDLIHDTNGRRWVLTLITIGATLSFLLAAPFIALASAAAFLCSELADFAIYTPLRRRGYIRAAIASNTIGSAVDTLLFLTIAGFPVWAAFPGQMVGKLCLTLAVVLTVWGLRALLRQPVRA